MHASPAPLSRPPAQVALVAVWALSGCFSDAGQKSDTHATTHATTTDEASTGEPTGGPADGCGDAKMDPGEACDYGAHNNGVDGNLCKTDCSKNVCGDGYLAVTEGCDDGNDIDDDACTNLCAPSGCGDAVVGPGEACDDGNDIDDDACTNLCALPSCGDGNLGPDELCDDGPANGDDRPCKLDCTLAVCGDGVVLAGSEVCDDGNDIDGDACSNTCTATACGDGVVQPGEACDDGNRSDDDTCSATCERLGFLAFVTSQAVTGDFGGPKKADDLCNTLAAAAALPGAGTYLAWLSDATTAPNQRFFKSTRPYIRPDGEPIAADWNDLTSGELLAPIEIDEHGQDIGIGNGNCFNLTALVWTNTTITGVATGGSCDQWTRQDSSGAAGSLTKDNSDWTQVCAMSCELSAHLYCFEQP